MSARSVHDELVEAAVEALRKRGNFRAEGDALGQLGEGGLEGGTGEAARGEAVLPSSAEYLAAGILASLAREFGDGEASRG